MGSCPGLLPSRALCTRCPRARRQESIWGRRLPASSRFGEPILRRLGCAADDLILWPIRSERQQPRRSSQRYSPCIGQFLAVTGGRSHGRPSGSRSGATRDGRGIRLTLARSPAGRHVAQLDPPVFAPPAWVRTNAGYCNATLGCEWLGRRGARRSINSPCAMATLCAAT